MKDSIKDDRLAWNESRKFWEERMKHGRRVTREEIMELLRKGKEEKAAKKNP